jgi:GMP synthase (glutamine-hydrolysing)
LIASTDSVKVAAFQIKDSQTYAIQFHPEVTHSSDGKQLLENFLVDICGCSQGWTPDAFVETTIADLKEKLGNDKVVLALSGGVDSSVAAILLHKAIGKNLHCIFVDNGLLRKNELPTLVALKSDNGFYIRHVDTWLKFDTQDIKNEGVAHSVHTNDDGTVLIKTDKGGFGVGGHRIGSRLMVHWLKARTRTLTWYSR